MGCWGLLNLHFSIHKNCPVGIMKHRRARHEALEMLGSGGEHMYKETKTIPGPIAIFCDGVMV